MIDREVITKIYKDLLADNQEKRAYVDGVFRGLQLMRDNLLITLDNVKSTQENPIKAESLATGAIQDGTLKAFDRALTEEEVKEEMQNDSDD